MDSGTVVLLTGCREGVGCSTIALALAGAATARGSAALVDANVGQPGLSGLMDTRHRFGWEDAIFGLCPFGQTAHHFGGKQALTFFPLRKPVTEPDDLFGHPALPEWVAQLRREHELILLDGGPVQEMGCRWAPWADAAVVVYDARHKVKDDWTRAWDRLEHGGTHVLGMVESFG